MNEAQASSCYCESCYWGVATSRWGPGRWAASNQGSWGQWSRRGRWAWRHASRGGAGSQPSTWLSSLSRRGRTARSRETGLRRPCTRRARNPATGARRDPRSCTGDIHGVLCARSLLAPPPPRISGPSRGVRGHGRMWGRPRVDAPQGCRHKETENRYLSVWLIVKTKGKNKLFLALWELSCLRVSDKTLSRHLSTYELQFEFTYTVVASYALNCAIKSYFYVFKFFYFIVF